MNFPQVDPSICSEIGVDSSPVGLGIVQRVSDQNPIGCTSGSGRHFDRIQGIPTVRHRPRPKTALITGTCAVIKNSVLGERTLNPSGGRIGP